ncbi:MAG: prephenate dehydrogenase/arogenate dehydrogenase family protein [Anaerolineae bacterium]|nr:prephenate dehydrogenase/arogenate dehydrogenase family protein [Anaerolineae bacterium]
MKTENITIIGLDRTGISAGLALKAAGMTVTIAGHDADGSQMQRALEMGAIDMMQERLGLAAAEADILILSLSAEQVENTLAAIAPSVRGHAVILDLSPLKARSQELAEQHLTQGHFVGARLVLAAPALDDSLRGPAGASADLFQNSLICLMPSPRAEPKAVDTAVTLGSLLGAKPFFLDAGEYDSLVKGVETLPGLVAAAMFRAVTRSQGWRDMLRFAGLPFAVGTAALQDNSEIAVLALHDRDATLRWLDAVLHELHEIQQWVYEQDPEQLSAYLQQLHADRQRWLGRRAENEWEESVAPDIKPIGMRDRIFGYRGESDN